MGGSAFKEHGLSTPRMPPTVYYSVLKQIEHKLSTVFPKVAHCIEQPEKKNYGDLDILVLPDLEKPVPALDQVSELLNAKRSYHEPSNGVSCFAIPWPNSSAISSTNSQDINATKSTPNNDAPARNQDSDLYIQLDLKFCTSQQDLTWRLFVHAHADLISIISATIRHKGLTITDKALYIRIKDIEPHNKKLARVELSRDPNQVLRYLGLNTTRFWQPFCTLDELMTYIATCRFHNPARINSADMSELGNDETTRTTLNTYDNHRLTCRPMFQYWFQTYLPSHTTDRPGISAHLTREEVVSNAFTFFGPAIKEKYEKQRRETTTLIERSQLWSNVRTKILASKPDTLEIDIHDTLKALKRDILPSPSQTSPTPIQNSYSTDDFPTVISYALANHATILTRYRQWLADSANKADYPLDPRKSNPYSKSQLEMYSAGDDEVIVRMKRDGATWMEILDVLGKRSRSQLVAHWKILQGKEQERERAEDIAKGKEHVVFEGGGNEA